MIRENIITETNPTATGGTTATAVATTTAITAAQSYFSRKIGNTTFIVSVAFSGKSNESIEDKILRVGKKTATQPQKMGGTAVWC